MLWLETENKNKLEELWYVEKQKKMIVVINRG